MQRQNTNNESEVYQRVAPGEALSKTTSHVVLDLQDQGASKADMHIGDLVYYTNQRMVTDLNTFLKSQRAPFGPYQYISEVATKLQQLQHKPNKAAQLRGYLNDFAASQGFDEGMFDQWSEVVFAKDRRDWAAHPLKQRIEDLSFLRGLLSSPSSPIAHCSAAVDALVQVAGRLGLK
jgi:hypothetical protein